MFATVGRRFVNLFCVLALRAGLSNAARTVAVTDHAKMSMEAVDVSDTDHDDFGKVAVSDNAKTKTVASNVFEVDHIRFANTGEVSHDASVKTLTNEVSAMEYDNVTNARVSNLPPQVMAIAQDLMMRDCAMKYVHQYIELQKNMSGVFFQNENMSVVDLEPSNAFAKAKAEVALQFSKREGYPKLQDLTVHREDDGVDDPKYPDCEIGLNFVKCAESLPPSFWLEQRWALEDILNAFKNKWWWGPFKGNGGKDFDKKPVEMKTALLDKALKLTSFSASRAKKYCKSIADDPDVDDVRQCVFGEIPGFMEKGHQYWQPKLEKLVKELWRYQDQLLVLGKMTNPKHTGTGDTFKKHLAYIKSQIENVENRRKALLPNLNDNLLTKHFTYFRKDAIDKAFTACKKKQQSLAVKNGIVQRAMSEVLGVCNKNKNCTEIPDKYCPSGYACDCQRAWTPRRAKKALVAGTVIGIPLTWGVGAAIGFFAAGPAGMAPGAYTAAAVVPDPVPGLLAAAVFTKKWFPECMCFLKKCVYDEEAGLCTMQATKKMSPSSNPVAHLPSDGTKCVPKAKEDKKCEVQECNPGDAHVKGPTDFLYGRVGKYKGGLYNCANTQGTLSSLLSHEEKLPSAKGEKNAAENSPAHRAKLLTLYEKANAPVPATEEAKKAVPVLDW